jgi:ATP-dependent RNA helicase RhlE
MDSFEDLNLSKQLKNAITELGFESPTPIQSESFSVILSGKDMVGIAQTGTGKTLAYMMPLLHQHKYSEQKNPRILVMVPTRELVLQVVDRINEFAQYISLRVIGVYGGTNINTQMMEVSLGCDVVVATPGRLYDLALSNALKLKSIKKLVIDEVDVMLDLGFRPQLINIFEILPEKRQNIMFSATMTTEVDELIDDFFISPSKISIAVSGTPLDNIKQSCYPVVNFYTKANLLQELIKDKDTYHKVLVFTSSKKAADRLYDTIEERFGSETAVIHGNKSQNYRIRSIEQFDKGEKRILITTDVMARGLDLDRISHVINFEVPNYPENYMHRIGRTGRAEEEGEAITFFTKKEKEYIAAIQSLMDYEIPQLSFPDEVEISSDTTPEERPDDKDLNDPKRNEKKREERGAAFHEKSDKNKKTNQGGSYRRDLAKKYKKRRTKGDKTYNQRNKKK